MKTIFYTILLTGLSWFGYYTIGAQLVINEYSCANRGHHADNFGSFPDWVELHNPSGAPVSTNGLFLSDRFTNPLKWALPNVNVPAGGFLRIFLSGRNLTAAPPYHASFKVNQTLFDPIVLSDINGNIVDSITTRPTQRDHSRGRTTDGAATWSLFTTPTPNATNTGAQNDYPPAPVMSVPRGYYPGALNVSLSCADPTATIRYTTNGAEPTSASAAYTGPINVNATTVVRARAFSGSAPASFITTHTYLINVNHSLPVVSLSGPYNNFFSTGGNPTYSHLEFFDANKVFQFESYGEINKHGNDSWAFPQKGLDFITRDQCGYDHEMNYPIFHTSPRPSYQRIMFKAGASDNYPSTWGNGGAHIRDAFVQSLSEKVGMKLDLRRLEHCIVFVNGQYWGVYEIRKKVNDPDYTEYYHGQKEEDLDMLSYWGSLNIRYGSDADWVNLFNTIMASNMANPADYNAIAARLDLDNVIDYMILNTWSINSDWLNWNTMWYRGRGNPSKKWAYVLWDQDNIFDLGHNYTGLPTTDFNADPCDYDNLFPNAGPSLGHMKIMNKLMQNPDFRARYVNRYFALVNGGLSCAYALNHLDSLINVLTPEMTMHAQRWGGSVADWQQNVQYLRNQILGRCQTIVGGLQGCYNVDGPHRIAVNVFPPNSGTVNFNGTQIPNYPWSNTYLGNLQANATATPNFGWNFSHWETFFHNIPPDSTANPAIFNLAAPDSIVAHFKRDDSLTLTYRVLPPLSGSIRRNGIVIPAYPFVETAMPNNFFNVEAQPMSGYQFQYWEINHHTLNPDSASLTAAFNFNRTDTLIAHFIMPPIIPPAPDTTPDGGIWIPSAFTPNKDKLNEVFRIHHNSSIEKGEYQIFDRWGEELFRAASLSDGWDGTYRNTPVMPGVYVYRVQYFDKKDKQWRSRIGHVELIR